MLDKTAHRRAHEVITVVTITIAILTACSVALGAGQLTGTSSESEPVAMTPAAVTAANLPPTIRLRRVAFAPRRHHAGTTTVATTASQPTTTLAAIPRTTDPVPLLTTLPPTTQAPATTAPTTAPPTAPPTASPAGQLIFDDEFNGGSLDLSKWQPNWLGNGNAAITKPINGAEVSCYDPSQVSVSGGSLHLDAAARPCTDSSGNKYSYASGIVTTNGHFTFTYGHLEARMCVPGSGAINNWPAFWADGTGTWPVTGELDVMEGLSGRAAGHFHSPSGGPGVSAPASVNGAGCHVYAAEWTPGNVTFIYDGQTIGSITSGITSAPMYLILNLGVGGYGGAIQAPSTMTVDYVRVWKT